MRDAMCHSAPLFKCARSPQHLSERMLPFVCNGIFVPPFSRRAVRVDKFLSLLLVATLNLEHLAPVFLE